MGRVWLAAGAAALALAGAAQAEGALRGARVGASDVPALAKFYETVFGLKEVGKFSQPGLEEIIMNYGADEAAAKANTAPIIVVMGRAADAKADDIPHFVLLVDDLDKTLAAVKENGGSVDREPFGYGQMKLAFVRDPQGNQIELQDTTP